jgi:hypothetical protein
METGEPIITVGINYSVKCLLWSFPIVEALKRGADCYYRRTTDTGLTLAPMIYNWLEE